VDSAASRRFGPVVLAVSVGTAVFLGAYAFLGRSSEPAPERGAADIRVITKGQPVDLRDHLVPGKYTLVDYYADWCPPCRELSPLLEELARLHPNLAIRKVDIVDWSHPVAEQQGVRDLPYLRLFDPEGNLLSDGDATYRELELRFGFRRPAQLL
jgi:thiol-disulfide isomerase/thioredoxin